MTKNGAPLTNSSLIHPSKRGKKEDVQSRATSNLPKDEDLDSSDEMLQEQLDALDDRTCRENAREDA